MEDVYSPLKNEYDKLQKKYDDIMCKLNLSGKTVESYIKQKQDCEIECQRLKETCNQLKEDCEKAQKDLHDAEKV